MSKKTNETHGKLYIIGTPIGNLQDITLRALDVLKNEVNILYCEDTRTTRKLLNRHEVSVELRSYTEHNEEGRIPQILEDLKKGLQIGLVSDAGMPVISDPGYKLARSVAENGFELDTIPGPTAFVSALILSTMAPNAFYYGGFLPEKRGKRQKKLAEVAELQSTLIYYLSPYKVKKTLMDVLEVLGDRQCCIVREITKIYQESCKYRVSDYLAQCPDKKWKGELVLVIEGC